MVGVLSEVDEIVIGSPDVLPEEVRRERELHATIGSNFARERDEESLEVRIGTELISGYARNIAELDDIIKIRQRRFPRVHTKQLYFAKINLNTFPLAKIEHSLVHCEFEQLHVTIRGDRPQESLLEFVRRHETKEISVDIEDCMLDMPSLLSLPRLARLNSPWLSGFRCIWDAEHSLSEADFVEIVNKRHASTHLPVNLENEQALLEIIKVVSTSDVPQHVLMRVRRPPINRFFSMIGLVQADGKYTVDESSGFTAEGYVLRYGDAQITFRWCLTRGTSPSGYPKSIEMYLVNIERAS